MADFGNLFMWMNSYGLIDALLPFLLIFVIVFATLQKTKIIGTGEKKFNVIVALILAFLVVLPHLTGTYPPNGDIVVIINNALPNISLVMVAILTLLLLIGVFAPVDISSGVIGGMLVIVSLIAVVFFFGQAAGLWGTTLPNWLGFLADPDTQAVIIILAVFGLVLWFITREEGTTKVGGGLGGFFKGLINDVKR
ncbi:hypothetical protein JXB11_00590 [Candidatus Woesearchaeota archaeon]|nr:hypothetical protein [Candidatus Woesearchaeota archaeon]